MDEKKILMEQNKQKEELTPHVDLQVDVMQQRVSEMEDKSTQDLEEWIEEQNKRLKEYQEVFDKMSKFLSSERPTVYGG